MLFLLLTFISKGQDDSNKAHEIQGLILLDGGNNVNQIETDENDIVHPSKLPISKNQYGTNGDFFFSVRQIRQGYIIEVSRV
jgi:hypothetical protein